MPHTPEFIDILKKFSAHADGDMERLYLAAVRSAAEHGRVTADDLRCVELERPDRDKRIFGGALAQLARKGVLVIVGETQTQQKGSNGRPIKVFALAHDWRSQWLKDDRLPVPQELVDIKVAHTETAAQVPQDQLFSVLAEVNRLAVDALNDPLVHRAQALDRIRELTARWAPKAPPVPRAAARATNGDLFGGQP